MSAELVERLNKLVEGNEFQALTRKPREKRGICMGEPSMAESSGYEQYFNANDLRDPAYAATALHDPFIRYITGPTLDTNKTKGFDIGMIAAASGTGKTSLIESLRTAILPGDLVRIAVTFNNTMEHPDLRLPLSTRVLFAYFFGFPAQKAGMYLELLDNHLVQLLSPAPSVPAPAIAIASDARALPLVLSAIAVDALKCRGLAAPPRVVLFVDEATKVGDLNAQKRVYSACTHALNADVGVVITALTAIQNLLEQVTGSGRWIHWYALGPIVATSDRLFAVIADQFRAAMPTDQRSCVRAEETLRTLLALTGGHARSIKRVVEALQKLFVANENAPGRINDATMQNAVVCWLADTTASSTATKMCEWLGPSMFRVKCSNDPGSPGATAFLAGAFVNTRASDASFVPQVSLYALFRYLPPDVSRAMFVAVEEAGMVFERLWMPTIALKLQMCRSTTPYWPPDLAKPSECAIFGGNGLFAVPHSRFVPKRTSVFRCDEEIADAAIVVDVDIFASTFASAGLCENHPSVVLWTTKHNEEAIDGVVLLRMKDGGAHAVLMQLKHTRRDKWNDFQFAHAEEVIEKTNNVIAKWASAGAPDNALRRFGVKEVSQFTLCIVALRKLGPDLANNKLWLNRHCADEEIEFGVALLGPRPRCTTRLAHRLTKFQHFVGPLVLRPMLSLCPLAKAKALCVSTRVTTHFQSRAKGKGDDNDDNDDEN